MSIHLGLPRFDERAACRDEDAELWFPEKGGPMTFAKNTCADCAVRLPCGKWAIENMEHGIWGGLTERDRERIRGARKRSVSA